jgi:hypothetical protein
MTHGHEEGGQEAGEEEVGEEVEEEQEEVASFHEQSAKGRPIGRPFVLWARPDPRVCRSAGRGVVSRFCRQEIVGE